MILWAPILLQGTNYVVVSLDAVKNRLKHLQEFQILISLMPRYENEKSLPLNSQLLDSSQHYDRTS